MVGLTRPERLALGAAIGTRSGAQKRLRQGMRRDAQGQSIKPGAGEQRYGRARPARQDQGEWSRPKALGEHAGALIQYDKRLRRGGIGHMDNQRVEARAILDREDRRDRAVA